MYIQIWQFDTQSINIPQEWYIQCIFKFGNLMYRVWQIGKELSKKFLPCPLENSISGDLGLVIEENLPDC